MPIDLADGRTAVRPEATPEPYDFRGTNKFGREEVRALQVAHELFARSVASSLGGQLRGLVQVEPMGIEQITFGDYISSTPSPAVLGIVDLAPLPVPAVADVDVGLGLSVVDRVLGGNGAVHGPRRPTELELDLLRQVFGGIIDALRATLRPYSDAQPSLQNLEHNPQLVQVAGPADLVVVLSFRVFVAQGQRTEGMLTLCYPLPTLEPLLEQMVGERPRPELPTGDVSPLAPLLARTPVEVTVRLGAVSVPAREVAALRPGDVIRLNLDADEAAVAEVEGHLVATGHVGRRGRRLALLVRDARADLAAAESSIQPTEPAPGASHA